MELTEGWRPAIVSSVLGGCAGDSAEGGAVL